METKETLEARHKHAVEGWIYSIERMDLLIISISSAGVYVTLEALKYSLEHQLLNTATLKFVGTAFIIAIILNIGSQFTGRKSNYYCIKACKEKLKQLELGQDELYSDFQTNADQYDTITHYLNNTSIIVMLLALSCLIGYFVATF